MSVEPIQHLPKLGKDVEVLNKVPKISAGVYKAIYLSR